MEHKHRRYTGCQKHAEGIICIKRNRNTAPNDNHIHRNDKHRSDKAKLFTGNSKNKVRMVFRQKVQLALRSGQPAFAKKSAAADSNFRLNNMITAAERIKLRIQKNTDTVLLIILQNHPKGRQQGHKSQSHAEEPFIFEAADKNHTYKDSNKGQRGS